MYIQKMSIDYMYYFTQSKLQLQLQLYYTDNPITWKLVMHKVATSSMCMK